MEQISASQSHHSSFISSPSIVYLFLEYISDCALYPLWLVALQAFDCSNLGQVNPPSDATKPHISSQCLASSINISINYHSSTCGAHSLATFPRRFPGREWSCVYKMVNIFYTFYFDSSFTFVFGVIADGKSLSADFFIISC